MDNNKENKITIVLRNFIDELSKKYEMSSEEKEVLEKMAEENVTKLFFKKQDA